MRRRKQINSDWILVWCAWNRERDRASEIKGNGGSLESDNWTVASMKRRSDYISVLLLLYSVCVCAYFWRRVCTLLCVIAYLLMCFHIFVRLTLCFSQFVYIQCVCVCVSNSELNREGWGVKPSLLSRRGIERILTPRQINLLTHTHTVKADSVE